MGYLPRSAKTGKHILCEKPMANSSSEARRMIDVGERAKVKLTIGYRQQYAERWCSAQACYRWKDG